MNAYNTTIFTRPAIVAAKYSADLLHCVLESTVSKSPRSRKSSVPMASVIFVWTSNNSAWLGRKPKKSSAWVCLQGCKVRFVLCPTPLLFLPLTVSVLMQLQVWLLQTSLTEYYIKFLMPRRLRLLPISHKI